MRDYFNRWNPDLLTLIPPDTKTVLEIGCGAGALAEQFRRVNPDVQWYAYEADPEAARTAEDRGVIVRGGDVERSPMGWHDDGAPEVDVLIYGDVLEHLVDPWRELERRKMWLKPGGLILACIPNVQHWSVITSLLSGQWPRHDEGLFDKTHLRWFTLDSIREMFAGARLDVFEIRGRCINDGGAFQGHSEYEWFVKIFRQASYGGCSEMGESVLEGFGIASDTFANQVHAYQYVVRALKPPAEVEPFHIHAVVNRCPENGTCCERPRIDEPLRALQTIPGIRTTIGTDMPSDLPPSVLIQQRDFDIHLEWQAMVAEKTVIVAEWDDDPRAFPALAESDYLPLRAAHAVQVSTEALADVVRRWNPNVVVFENQLAELAPMPVKKDGPPSIIFGALNRQDSWRSIMPALNRVLADHPEIFVRAIHDSDFFDALETKHAYFYPFQDYEGYRQLLRQSHIALLPLEDTPFNRCKSDLKFLECAAEGVAVLASPVAYLDTLQDAHSGLCYASETTFEYHLRYIIGHEYFRRAMANDAYAYVRDHRMLRQHYRARLEWYRELVRRKSRLDRELLARCPELSGSSRSAPLASPA
jgi:SAM-dependent methyltransferase